MPDCRAQACFLAIKLMYSTTVWKHFFKEAFVQVLCLSINVFGEHVNGYLSRWTRPAFLEQN